MKKGGVGSCGPHRYMLMMPHHSKNSCTVLSDHSQALTALGCVLCTAILTRVTKSARRQLRPRACCGWNANRSPTSSGGITRFVLPAPGQRLLRQYAV